MSSAMSSNLANAGSGGYPRDAERAKTIDGGNEETARIRRRLGERVRSILTPHSCSVPVRKGGVKRRRSRSMRSLGPSPSFRQDAHQLADPLGSLEAGAGQH